MTNFNFTHSQLGSAVWSPHEHAHLKLPDGTTCGVASTENIRRQLGLLGIAGAHTKPRLEIIAAYAESCSV